MDSNGEPRMNRRRVPIFIPVHSSNVEITELKMSKARQALIERKTQAVDKNKFTTQDVQE
eukprot:TRINITY_DN2641_c0_g1_i1.p3 TRINITY_DN2641_c0_g1~~TRINITY_DN2641_c0_g1_i1.p3  ORF type:complete len:60 (-),score=19.65 TRINITY_DN2641_c0_g1_i1:459-638(-)